MKLAIRRAVRWLRFDNRQPTLSDIWASLLMTEPPCEGTISAMVSDDMIVDDFIRKELANL